MNIKEELKKLQPGITDQLPNGAIAQIAEEMNLTRQSVTRMLSGQFGAEENLIRMLQIVSNIALNEGAKQQNLSQTISVLLHESQKELSA